MGFKRYKVTVGGKDYEVEVEELSGYPETLVTTSRPAGKSAASAPVQEAKSSAPAGGTEVKAPLQGVVLGLQAKVGSSVKKGDVLLKIEALKMENEVLSPVSGTVKSVAVTDGQRVSSGDSLVVIE